MNATETIVILCSICMFKSKYNRVFPLTTNAMSKETMIF